MGVLIEVGVKTRSDRNAETIGGGDGRGTERAFGGHVHQIGSVDLPELAQPAAGGKADSKLRIAGQGKTWEAHLPAGQAMRNAKTWRFVALPRTYDGDAVTALGEAVNKAAERHGDAVDFRCVGFGYEGEMQIVAPVQR